MRPGDLTINGSCTHWHSLRLMSHARTGVWLARRVLHHGADRPSRCSEAVPGDANGSVSDYDKVGRTAHVAATTPLRTQHELQPVLRWLVLTTHWNNVDDLQGLGAVPMARCRGWSCCNSAVGILQPS